MNILDKNGFDGEIFIKLFVILSLLLLVKIDLYYWVILNMYNIVLNKEKYCIIFFILKIILNIDLFRYV